jgi:glycosyltransferase involved in cell wall biosynthesis
LPIVALALLFRKPVVWQHIDYDTVSPRGICHADGRSCQFALARCYRCLRRDQTRGRAIKSILSLFAKRAAAHAVTFNLLSSEYARKRMPLPRLEFLAFGIDTDFWTPAPRAPSPTLRVFFYGRHIPGKGCDVLVRAVRRCRDEGVSLSVRIAGDGPHRGASERLSRELGLSGLITFLGFQPEESIRAELRNADVVAVPALQDEIGQFVAFEAMACGCAVVASSIGALPEHLGGGAGVLFPAGDDTQLARILSRLATDPEAVAALAGRGRERVRADFDWRVMGQRYLDLYARAA